LIERVGGNGIGQRLIREGQAMAQYVRRQVGHVLRHHVGAAAQERERARRLDQVDRGPRAGAIREIFR